MGVGYGSYYSEAKMKPIDEIIERNTRSDEINKDLIKNYKKGGIPITDKEFSEYSEKRDKEIEQYIKDLYEGTAPENKVLNEEGNVVTKKYNELDKDQIIEATSSIKRRATNKVKEDLFGKKKLTSEERQRANRLKAARKSSD